MVLRGKPVGEQGAADRWTAIRCFLSLSVHKELLRELFCYRRGWSSLYVAFIIGNIASGKSTASRYLEGRGARRIDLDELAKSLYVPGSPVVADLAAAFGAEVLDEEGAVRRDVLASRAFCSPERAQELDAIVYPALLAALGRLLLPSSCSAAAPSEPALTVVEISNAAAFTESFTLADDILAIDAPLELRRARALARGMAAADFDARAQLQPADAELRALASSVIENGGSDAELFCALDRWAEAHGLGPDGSPVLEGDTHG